MVLYYSRILEGDGIMDKTLLWLWLSLHMKQGTHVYQYLLDEFGSIEAIYSCEDNDVENLPWLYDYHKKKILDKNLDRAKEVLRWCNKAGVNIVTLEDDDYPATLKDLVDRPGVLYYVGTLPDFSKELSIGVVGTREMTLYGQRCAFEIGYGLTKGGAIVVSGGALGIDCTAQKGAIAAGGSTIAILGSGIDVLYPPQNKELLIKIMETGAVITEYPPFTPPNRYNFPVRNRLISGLSKGVVIVEADKNSGAMITADKAKAQHRYLFSVPGPINVFQSTGTNELISTGAKSVTSALDILEEYLDLYSDKIQITPSKEKPDLKLLDEFNEDSSPIRSFLQTIGFNRRGKKKKNTDKENNEVAQEISNQNGIDIDTLGVDENAKKIYKFMEKNKKYNVDSFDELGLKTNVIVSSFTMLEIFGAVKSLPGGFFEKN